MVKKAPVSRMEDFDRPKSIENCYSTDDAVSSPLPGSLHTSYSSQLYLHHAINPSCHM